MGAKGQEDSGLQGPVVVCATLGVDGRHQGQISLEERSRCLFDNARRFKERRCGHLGGHLQETSVEL